MKKLMMMLIVAGVAAVANAASFKWSALGIYGPDGNQLNSGSASLYCDALSSSPLSTVGISSGKVAATTIDVADAVANTEYSFYFVVTTTYQGAEKTFTAAAKGVTALNVGTANISFGSQASATQAEGAWGAVPEPTSALLLVLGVAGLALKRKRV